MKKLVCMLLVLAMCLGPGGCARADEGPADEEPAALTVRAFAAGAADAFLLTTDGSAVLIDCGEKGFGKQITACLEELGIGRLDALIVTHFDKDHVGGAAKVISSVPIDRVLQSNYPKDSKPYRKYLEALEEAGLTAETVREELSFTLDGVLYEIDPPAETYSEDESNNSSLIVSVTNGGDELLFMGDAEDARIAGFLRDHQGGWDFLKVPHHGRAGDMTAALIAAVRPAVAVITSSEEEPEDAEVLALLKKAGAEVYLTREAPVIVESGGSGVTARSVQSLTDE